MYSVQEKKEAIKKVTIESTHQENKFNSIKLSHKEVHHVLLTIWNKHCNSQFVSLLPMFFILFYWSVPIPLKNFFFRYYYDQAFVWKLNGFKNSWSYLMDWQNLLNRCKKW